MKLVLGVNDLVYQTPARRGRSARARGSRTTTGQVAQILEHKYGLMQKFFDHHVSDIGSALESSIAGSLETMMQGGPAKLNLGSATEKIETMFREALTNKEFDAMGIPGVPTAAAQAGYSKRFKRSRARRGPRPSFIDTGLYQRNFRAWVE